MRLGNLLLNNCTHHEHVLVTNELMTNASSLQNLLHKARFKILMQKSF